MKSKCKFCHRRISKRLKRAHEASCVPDGTKSFEQFKRTRSSHEQQAKAAKRKAAKLAKR